MMTQEVYGRDGVTCDPILAIHRGSDSYVTFHCVRERTQDDGTTKRVMVSDGAVRVEHLAGMFPEFRAELETDAYFSINGFYRHAGFGGQGRLRRIAALPHALRKFTSARYLNALYCDVDAYKIGMEPGMVVGRMLVMQDRGVVPPISIIVRSGQGVWAMWLLAAERGSDMPPKAHPHRQLLHGRLERELISRFAEFNVDKGTIDVARITRVPGSINSKCGMRVEYLFQTDGDGKLHMHTMDDVAAFLNVSTARATSPAPDPAHTARSIAAARRLAATMESRLYDFRLLWRLRRRFAEGSRNWAALVYAWLLRANKVDDATIRAEVGLLGRECRPPLDDYRVGCAIDSSKRYARITDAKIAEQLAVTSDEADIVPRFARPDPSVPVVTVTTAERRRHVLDIVTVAGRRLSAPDIVRRLASLGIVSNRMTVSRDLKLVFGSRRPASAQAPLPLKEANPVFHRECYISQG